MKQKLCGQTATKTRGGQVGYTADHILLKGETPDECRARKTNAISMAEKLKAKATVSSIAEYWQRVQDMAFHDLARLEELPC